MTDRSSDLRRALAQLRTAHRIAALGSWEADLDDPSTLQWSPEARAIAGLPGDQPLRFEDLVRLIHPDDRARFLDVRSAAITGDRPYAVDVRIVRPDGVSRHLHVAAEIQRDGQGRPTRLIGVVQDRTDEIEDLRQLRVTEAARRELLQRVIDTSDIERARIVRQLAGRPMHQLASVAAQLEDHIGPDEPPGWGEALDAVRRSIESLDRTLSSIADEPRAADLVDMVDELIVEITPELDITVDVDADLSLRPSLQATLVRIVQEALHNIRKHAAATSAAVRVEVSDGAVELVVADDGRGFDVDATATAPGHLGLASIRDRVGALGGALEIRSRPGRTVVDVRLPLT